MGGMGRLVWNSELCCWCCLCSESFIAGISSTRLASLFVHCLLDLSSRGWSVLGTKVRLDLLLRKRNWIIMASSLVVVAMVFRAVELSVATF